MNEQLHISIRRATRDDVAEIVRLLSDDMLGSTREKYRQPLPPAYYEAFREIDSDKNNELVVVEYGGEIIGTLQLTFIPSLSYQGGTRAQIEGVRVSEKYRSHGIGGRLIDWAIARASAKSCRLVQLTTNNERHAAHRFYERLGFASSHTGMKLDLTQRS
jgi:ribosomal protein S18 acetylase RimI-like enzyme